MGPKIDQVAPKRDRREVPRAIFENPVKRIYFLIHFGRPLASPADFANTLLKVAAPKLPASKGVGGRPRRYNGTQNRPSCAKKLQN